MITFTGDFVVFKSNIGWDGMSAAAPEQQAISPQQQSSRARKSLYPLSRVAADGAADVGGF